MATCTIFPFHSCYLPAARMGSWRMPWNTGPHSATLWHTLVYLPIRLSHHPFSGPFLDLRRYSGFLRSPHGLWPFRQPAARRVIVTRSSQMSATLVPLHPVSLAQSPWCSTSAHPDLKEHLPALCSPLPHCLPYSWAAGLPGRARPSPSHQTACGLCGRPRSPGHRRFQSASPAPAAGSLSPGARPQSPPRRRAPRSAY